MLWDLDVRHEYVLHRHTDHTGATILPCLERAVAWMGRRLDGALDAEEGELRAALATGEASDTLRAGAPGQTSAPGRSSSLFTPG